ncbi:helix-turn-helix domain-containing protein [Nonomuraea fuscirosea]|uniref:helix-turn-helix domain-containing protein n=1 Tax=Nonomuraea fuscirosea TaxID=1291556 RepID=UPI00342591A6
MGLDIVSRPSDSPYIDRVWRSRSDDVCQMTAVAAASWDLVFWERHGEVSAAVVGPETAASPAPVPEEATFFGITFAVGTTMPHLPAGRLVNSAAELAGTTRRSFQLKGSIWRLPGYDDAEAFVRRLVREEILVRDPLVAAVHRAGSPEAHQGASPPAYAHQTAPGASRVSERTVQRRFLAATGLTRGAARQIDRARRAAVLIQAGVPARDVVHRLGYFDQPHLARSLTRFVGRTATELSLGEGLAAGPLSLLYAT